jgi:hypothetical protein
MYGDVMKVLTIKQPWATLIAQGYKAYEFRSWHTKYRGPLIIHAGQGVDKNALKRFQHLNLHYPKSQIVAIVQLEDCILIDENFNKKLMEADELVYGDNSKVGQYAWKLSNVKYIENQKNVKGRLGLWNIDDPDDYKDCF